ncbi:MAG: type VI secretion system-associated FHA domain protein TagH [Halopseudomonas sp.]|uniref:type VI secretion system-associated FHA domain protein TagH n=1 Tax=Halopseudomonas sp. TaxID=2901191 RepID=UPI00300130E2
MELVFDVVSAQQFEPGLPNSKTFRQAGGVIGRGEDCDWVIPDRKRIVSGRHAEVSFHNGVFYLTDTSSNGILCKDTETPLPKGKPQPIEHGQVFCFGEFDVRARLAQDPSVFAEPTDPIEQPESLIPDDAFLDLDPLSAMDQPEQAYRGNDDFALLNQPQPSYADQRADYARIDMESLPIPELRQAEQPAPAPSSASMAPGFWDAFAKALGLELGNLEESQREELALKAARLLKQNMGLLRQNLATQAQLKHDLAVATEAPTQHPLMQAQDSAGALHKLLRETGSDEATHQLLASAYGELQSHQVALVAASRGATKELLEQLSPEQLALRFEQDGGGSLLSTAGGRWRAYARLHQRLVREEHWHKELYAPAFTHAYQEQVRLIASLNSSYQG